MPRKAKKKKQPPVHPLVGHQARTERKVRRCLECGNDFNSRCPGNRVCPRCRRKESNTTDTWLTPMYHSVIGEPGD